MSDPPDPKRPIILCPLEFEYEALVAAGLEAHCTLVCTGPGRENIVTWARDHTRLDEPIILAGLAGSLSPELKVGSAHVVTLVIDEQRDDEWRPTILPPPPASPRDATDSNASDIPGSGKIIVTSTHAPVTGRLKRLKMHEETGCMMIDLESVAFAIAAQKYHWTRWGIVRGISDDLSTLLPENIDQWVDETGRTRWGQVMRSLLVKPTLIPVVVELRTNSTAAMKAVGAKLRSIVDSST